MRVTAGLGPLPFERVSGVIVSSEVYGSYDTDLAYGRLIKIMWMGLKEHVNEGECVRIGTLLNNNICFFYIFLQTTFPANSLSLSLSRYSPFSLAREHQALPLTNLTQLSAAIPCI